MGELTVVTDLECAPPLACACSCTCPGRLSRIGVLVLVVVIVDEIVVVHLIQNFVLPVRAWLPVWILLLLVLGIGELRDGFEVVHEGGREGSVRVVVLRAGGRFVVPWQVHPYSFLAVRRD